METYLFLAGAKRLPFPRNELCTFFQKDVLKVS